MTGQHTSHIGDVTGPVHTGRGDIIIQQAPPPLSRVEEPPAFRVLTIVARPLDQSALPEIGDAWSLADQLAQVQAPVELAFARPPTRETLRLRLAEDWDVVHFDGHGVWAWTCPDCRLRIPKEEGQPDPIACPRCDAVLTDPATGYLAFERENGLMDLLPATEMADLLCPAGAPPRARLVILTACQSALEAALPALRSLGPNPFSGTPFTDLPALAGPGSDAPLCEPGCRARTRVEREVLVGVPAPSSSGAFHGDFHPADPPGGRKGYLVQLARALLRDEKLVVLAGVGGIGKSALAAAAARRLAWHYPGGIFWVDGRDYLETEMRLEDVLGIFGQVYGHEFVKLPVARQRELALDYLRRLEAPALLVVDNGDVAGEDVFRFLRDVPRPSAVLVTTRTAPEYGGCVLDVAAMTPQEGLTFLAAEIGRRRNDPRWVAGLGEPARRNLLEIARLLDGHALALLQAGSMAGSMGLEYALAQARANPARGETGRRFDFSYEPLGEEQKELLHRLAAFAAGFDLETVQRIVTTEGEGVKPLPHWDADLPELVRCSFVERYALGPGYTRFRLHPVMREYLQRKAGPEAMVSYDRCSARYFLALAGWGGRQLGNTGTALQAVQMATLERANLLAAQEVAQAQELWDEAVSLAYRLGELFERSGHWGDRRRALEAGIEAAREGEKQRDEAGLAHNLAVLAQDMGDYDEARQLYQESLGIAQQLGNRAGVAYTLGQLGNLAYAQGELDEARRLYEQVRDVSEQMGDRKSIATALHQLGMLAQDTGNYDEARRLYQESLKIKQQLGNRAGVASTTSQLGILAKLQGDVEQSRRLHEESLAIRQGIGDKQGIAIDLHQLGMLAEEDGDLEEAKRLFSESLATFEALGSPDAEIARRSLERVEGLSTELSTD